MGYSKKQEELDLIKWVESEAKGYDTCGEYGYCKNCNKNEAYPCACAYEKFYNNNASKTIAKDTTKKSKAIKTTTKKTSCKKTTTKSTAKKPVAKKTTKTTAKAY